MGSDVVLEWETLLGFRGLRDAQGLGLCAIHRDSLNSNTSNPKSNPTTPNLKTLNPKALKP